MTLVGLNERTAATRLEMLQATGRALARESCPLCREAMLFDKEALGLARSQGEARLVCSDCVSRALPAPPVVEGQAARHREPGDDGDGDFQRVGSGLRKINFTAPFVEPLAPPRLDVEAALVKVRRAGAPADAIATLRGQLAEEKPLALSLATKAAIAWCTTARRDRPLLPLMGPTGLGKTTAAARACLEFARDYPWNTYAGGTAQREPLMWLNAEDVELLQSWQKDGARQYEEALHAKLLVLDDAGHEDIRPAIAAMTDLLMRRLDAKRATILTTNLRGKAFAARYGGPVVDRMKAKACLVELAGQPSLRKRSEP